MTATPIRVIKLGGSLLDTMAVERLPAWLGSQTPMNNLLVVGGGRRVETIRKSQQTRGWNDRQAHWLSIQAMDRTAKLVQQRLAAQGNSFDIVDSLDPSRNRPFKLSIFTVKRFLCLVDARRKDRLPENWTVTSDSISARLAVLIDAAEFVLLKSALPASDASLAELSQTGFVDTHFPMVAGVPVIRVVNARGLDWPEMVIEPESRAAGIHASCRRNRRR